MAIEVSQRPIDEKERTFYKEIQFSIMLGALVRLARQIGPDKVQVALREEAYRKDLTYNPGAEGLRPWRKSILIQGAINTLGTFVEDPGPAVIADLGPVRTGLTGKLARLIGR